MSNDDRPTGQVAKLKAAQTTPQEVLTTVIQSVPRAVLIGWIGEDGQARVMWSTMMKSDVCWLGRLVDQGVDEAIAD